MKPWPARGTPEDSVKSVKAVRAPLRGRHSQVKGCLLAVLIFTAVVLGLYGLFVLALRWALAHGIVHWTR